MAFTRAGGPRAKLYTMHQFLEFDVAETDGIRVLDGSSASYFQKGTATYAVPCDAAWDRQLLGHRLEFCVLDESDLAGDAYVGMASMLLSPLLSRRGMRANLSLYDPDGQVSGQLKVEVAWDPEPIPPKVSRNDANRHVLEGIVRSVRALGPGKKYHLRPTTRESRMRSPISVLTKIYGFAQSRLGHLPCSSRGSLAARVDRHWMRSTGLMSCRGSL